MKLKRKLKRFLPLYLMLVPGFLYLAFNNYAPIYGLLMAFQKVNFRKGILGGKWIGLDNFRFLFRGDAWLITRNTVLYNIAFLVLGPIVGITIAILLNNLRSKKAAGAYQTIILIPFLMSMVVISYIAYAFLSPQSGLINSVLDCFVKGVATDKITTIDKSIESHFIALAAEESRINGGKVVDMDEFESKF